MKSLLSLVVVILTMSTYVRLAEAQYSPAEQKKLQRATTKIMRDKKLSNEGKRKKVEALQEAARERLKKKSVKKKTPPRFKCARGNGKHKVVGTAELSESMPGRWVWLDVTSYVSGEDTSSRNYKGNYSCGVGFTTRSKKMQVEFAVDKPGFYVFALHVDADDDRRRSEAGDFHGYAGGTVAKPITRREDTKPMEIKGKRTKGIFWGVGPSQKVEVPAAADSAEPSAESPASEDAAVP